MRIRWPRRIRIAHLREVGLRAALPTAILLTAVWALSTGWANVAGNTQSGTQNGGVVAPLALYRSLPEPIEDPTAEQLISRSTPLRLKVPLTTQDVSFGLVQTQSKNLEPGDAIGQVDVSGIALDPYDDEAIWVANAYAFDPCGSLDVVTCQPHGNYRIAVGKVFGSIVPDLTFVDLKVDGSAFSTTRGLDVTADIRNQGDGPSPGTRIQFYLVPQAFLKEWLPVGELDLAGLLSGDHHAIDDTDRPTWREPDDYKVVGYIDPDNNVAEYSDGNNAMTARRLFKLASLFSR